ncbi:MAG TPA: FAD-binding protein, partial [Marinobacter sp.]|nr:FAD-binding protein [Marinobacter sp.]
MNIDRQPLNTAASKPGKAELAKMFREFIDPQFVITDEETLKPYECDGLSMYCVMPLLVALPETVEQVQQVMRLCHRFGIPVVARGAGTGLSAGAMPDAGGVVLSLAKFNR